MGTWLQPSRGCPLSTLEVLVQAQKVLVSCWHIDAECKHSDSQEPTNSPMVCCNIQGLQSPSLASQYNPHEKVKFQKKQLILAQTFCNPKQHDIITWRLLLTMERQLFMALAGNVLQLVTSEQGFDAATVQTLSSSKPGAFWPARQSISEGL